MNLRSSAYSSRYRNHIGCSNPIVILVASLTAIMTADICFVLTSSELSSLTYSVQRTRQLSLCYAH